MKTKFFKNTLTAAAVAASLGIVLPLSAQDVSRGNLIGQAQDQDGQVISSVAITITNLETGLTRSVTSSETGAFRFPLLPPGAYSLRASKAGYGVVAEENITVRVGGNTNMNIVLFTEGSIESIEVRGSRVALLGKRPF